MYPSSKIVRQLAGSTARIFNDKLVNGVRSYKVWGWAQSDYERCVSMLQANGIAATLIIHRAYSSRGARWYEQPRIHVT